MDAVGDREVRRILERYLVEVVERYDLCPWARSARVNGEVGVAIVWGAAPPVTAWIDAARALLARPETRVAMVVGPQLALDLRAMHGLRNEVAAAIVDAGVAEFHPEAALDLATPPRLVPFLRRAPDPLLQLVPLSLLAAVRSNTLTAVERLEQARMLGNRAAPPRPDVGDRIASANHATASSHHAAIEHALDAIAADRAASYARVGISTCR